MTLDDKIDFGILGVLNFISIIVTCLFFTGLIYLFFDFTIGRIKFLKSKFEYNGLQIKDFVFITIAVLIMVLVYHPYLPY